ncbi:pentapeptide repeat-containing protein [Ornithinibacillus scapharcae]|uniref:pentapeptide repeat-containing protein n=1 Tax=Ornithinibacillus scapharcae TaxID=1147159 RepID=UPI000225B368|nr:pentapeptide repeat-containing protein [Ornithinibacillus scapharcae]
MIKFDSRRGREMEATVANRVRKSLTADCSACFGLCCTALNIIASSDFAMDKPAGTPCTYLQEDFKCHIHKDLRKSGFKGCTVYDCLGAGQKVSQDTFKGYSWRENPTDAKQMFEVFPVMEQLYEMIAFISEALTYEISKDLRMELTGQLEHLQSLIELDARNLVSLNMAACRLPVNEVLLKTSEVVRSNLSRNVFSIRMGRQYRGMDLIGRSLKGKDLRTADFRGALLIKADLRGTDLRGADFIGADLRDANLCGANLTTSMFLTQMQINSASGNNKTLLPSYIQRPSHWF